MYRILVCDDEIEITRRIVNILNTYADLYDIEVIGFCNAKELMEYCHENRFDIIYLDIQLGSCMGTDLGKRIKAFNPEVLIVYISSHDNYYVHMVQAEPFRFIHKEMFDTAKMDKEIADTLEFAMKRVQRKRLWSFVFDREQYFVDLWRVEYFYSSARKIYIVGRFGEGEIPEYFYGKISELQKELEKTDDSFFRINRRYIINMRYVRYMGEGKMKVGEQILTLSLDYSEKFFDVFRKYGQFEYRRP